MDLNYMLLISINTLLSIQAMQASSYMLTCMNFALNRSKAPAGIKSTKLINHSLLQALSIYIDYCSKSAQ